MARDAVVGQGITINGLPLMTTGGFSSTYDNLKKKKVSPTSITITRTCVIGGPAPS